MTIILGADHGGFELKQQLVSYLNGRGIATEDLGTHQPDSVDYPDIAHLVASRVAQAKTTPNNDPMLGILVCGTGIGMSITANRHPGIRAALVNTTHLAAMAKQHNNANILVLGGRILNRSEAIDIVAAWLDSTYEGGRHQRRLDKINN